MGLPRAPPEEPILIYIYIYIDIHVFLHTNINTIIYIYLHTYARSPHACLFWWCCMLLQQICGWQWLRDGESCLEHTVLAKLHNTWIAYCSDMYWPLASVGGKASEFESWSEAVPYIKTRSFQRAKATSTWRHGHLARIVMCRVLLCSVQI